MELLLRAAELSVEVGEYIDHTLHPQGVIVRTQKGIINFSRELIDKQFSHPENVNRHRFEGSLLVFSAVSRIHVPQALAENMQ